MTTGGFEIMIENLADHLDRASLAPGDYYENGIRMCGKCHTPKQAWIILPKGWKSRPLNGKRLVPVMCQCKVAEEEARKRTQEKVQFNAHMAQMQDSLNLSDNSYRQYTFAIDDKHTPSISRVCQNYVEKWHDMFVNNIGILFYGQVGTGKSFYACAIVNALLDRLVSATVTSTPRLLSLLDGTKEKQRYIDSLQRYKFLVLDDLGVERDSSYASEQIYHIVDTRSKTKLPIIVTTNLTIEELQDPQTQTEARIYDRIMELCPIRICMTGESRRTDNAARRTELAKELLQT